MKRKSFFLWISLGVISLILFAFTYLKDGEVESQSVQSSGFHADYHIHAVELPDSVYFCDELMPLYRADVYESFDRELLVNVYWQSQTVLFIKRAHKYFPIIEKILQEQGVPDDMKYLAVAESGLSNVVSPAGASGFWQILKGTAGDYKLEVNEEVDERYHLEKSTEAAAKFLLDSYEKFGSWTLAAASYNMGRRNISKQLERQHGDSYYNLVLGEETGRYVYRIAAIKTILENPEMYGFYVPESTRYVYPEYAMVEVDSSIQQLGRFAKQQGINYKLLKELNPWLRDNVLSNKSGRTYAIKVMLPAE